MKVARVRTAGRADSASASTNVFVLRDTQDSTVKQVGHGFGRYYYIIDQYYWCSRV